MQEEEAKTNLKTLLAIYKAIQEVVEVCLDLLAMMLKDNDIPPKDDYYNIDLALKHNLISKSDNAVLKKANGLRNRVIHEYNGIDVDIAFESIEELLPDLEEYLDRVKSWSMEFFKK